MMTAILFLTLPINADEAKCRKALGACNTYVLTLEGAVETYKSAYGQCIVDLGETQAALKEASGQVSSLPWYIPTILGLASGLVLGKILLK